MEGKYFKFREEQIEEIKWLLESRLIASFGFLAAALILWMYKIFDFPIIMFSIAPLAVALLNQPYPFIVRRVENLQKLIFFHLALDTFFITWGIHFLGGMDAIYGVIVYVLTILLAGYLLSVSAAVALTTLSVLLYSGLLWLEYSNILPVIPVFNLELSLSIRLGMLFLAAAALYLIAYFAGFLGQAIRKRNEQSARHRDYVENIIETMVDTLLVIGPDLKIKTINKAASQLLGYKEEELVGKPLSTIFAEAEIDNKAKETEFKEVQMQRLIEDGTIREYEVLYKLGSIIICGIKMIGLLTFLSRFLLF